MTFRGIVAIVLVVASAAALDNGAAETPPMGWRCAPSIFASCQRRRKRTGKSTEAADGHTYEDMMQTERIDMWRKTK